MAVCISILGRQVLGFAWCSSTFWESFALFIFLCLVFDGLMRKRCLVLRQPPPPGGSFNFISRACMTSTLPKTLPPAPNGYRQLAAERRARTQRARAMPVGGGDFAGWMASSRITRSVSRQAAKQLGTNGSFSATLKEGSQSWMSNESRWLSEKGGVSEHSPPFPFAPPPRPNMSERFPDDRHLLRLNCLSNVSQAGASEIPQLDALSKLPEICVIMSYLSSSQVGRPSRHVQPTAPQSPSVLYLYRCSRDHNMPLINIMLLPMFVHLLTSIANRNALRFHAQDSMPCHGGADASREKEKKNQKSK